MSTANRNVAASVRARLLNRARAARADYNQLLTRYAIERLLYRLSASPHRGAFVLKGAMLFAVWEGSPYRPTRDVDFLGFGEPSESRLATIFRELCVLPVADDGLRFDTDSVQAQEVRATGEYGGIRVTLSAELGGATLRLQVDVGFGDAVTPAVLEAPYPRFFEEFPQAILGMYPRETAVAEKLEAVAKLGMLNTRLKDYYDLHHLARTFAFDGATLSAAFAATFARRGTALPSELPAGLTPAFAADPAKQTQWAAYRRRLGDRDAPGALADVVGAVAAFVIDPLRAASGREAFALCWEPPAGPWAAARDAA